MLCFARSCGSIHVSHHSSHANVRAYCTISVLRAKSESREKRQHPLVLRNAKTSENPTPSTSTTQSKVHQRTRELSTNAYISTTDIMADQEYVCALFERGDHSDMLTKPCRTPRRQRVRSHNLMAENPVDRPRRGAGRWDIGLTCFVLCCRVEEKESVPQVFIPRHRPGRVRAYLTSPWTRGACLLPSNLSGG